jgi:hypothetical protein
MVMKEEITGSISMLIPVHVLVNTPKMHHAGVGIIKCDWENRPCIKPPEIGLGRVGGMGSFRTSCTGISWQGWFELNIKY